MTDSASLELIQDRLLDVRGLAIEVGSRASSLSVVDDVSFSVNRGRTLGIVGESGSGKTMTSLALLGVLPRVARITHGSIRLDGRELIGLRNKELLEVRGRQIGVVFQEAARSLNPLFTIGNQISEVARTHLGLSRKLAWRRAVEMLDLVGIKRPADRASEYPHMLSGGMAQRAMIAMALTCEPHLLIADEPTTALDVTVQAQVLGLLKRLQKQMALGLVLITHDMGVVAEMCDDVTVMYAGQVVEHSRAEDLFRRPAHPYTAGLLAAIPRVAHRAKPFGHIPGVVPSPRSWPEGCRFHPRCPHSQVGRCTTGLAPDLRSEDARLSRCVRVGELELEGVIG